MTSTGTYPTEKLRIDSNGLMGLGVTPTSHNNTTAFQIYDDYNSVGYPRIRLTNQSSGTASSDGYEIVLDGSDLNAVHRLRENGNIYFMTNNLERVRITSGGQLQIRHNSSAKISIYHDSSGLNHITSNSGQEFKVSSGNGDSNGIEFWDYTGTNKRCQIDGHGIKFNADTAQANALDDYEEGSWTPTAQSGGSSVSYSSATYTKIGRTVHIQFRGSLNGVNGNTVQIGGLPFANLSNAHQIGPIMHNGFDFAGSTEPVPTSYITSTWSYFQMYYSKTNSQGWSAVTGNETGADQFITSLTYFTA
jgi:hypothetical protein